MEVPQALRNKYVTVPLGTATTLRVGAYQHRHRDGREVRRRCRGQAHPGRSRRVREIRAGRSRGRSPAARVRTRAHPSGRARTSGGGARATRPQGRGRGRIRDPGPAVLDQQAAAAQLRAQGARAESVRPTGPGSSWHASKARMPAPAENESAGLGRFAGRTRPSRITWKATK